ncbi:hypothetical protein EI94DRAFT_1742264 [Lactarius quietus]|nr:hypothetical protein EI94DRAFT_1742264 [Lactarius quietus]
MSDEFLSSFIPESVQAPSPESFEKYLEELLDFDNLDNDVDLPTLLDDPFPNYPDASALPLSSPSASTYSTTDLTDDTTNSDYSSMTFSTTNHPLPLNIDLRDVDTGSGYNGVYTKQPAPMFTDPHAFLDSLGSLQFPPDLFQTVQVYKAQSDDGPYRPSVGISPHCLSTAFQSPPPAALMDSPGGTASSMQTYTGPIRSKFVCPECGHKSARKHNLKTHMDTHNPDRMKPFVCPVSDCGHPFTRKHDLKRHLEAMHGDGPSD